MEIHHTGAVINTLPFTHGAKNAPQPAKAEDAKAVSGSEQQSLPASNQASNTQSGRDFLEDPAIQRQLNELRARDREVRAHEMAHVAAGAGLITGGPTYEYQKGPDNRLYAVGGEVQIDTSDVPGDPEATLEKALQIQRAALAPAEPSAQDRAVAMSAATMAAEARAELNMQRNNPDHESESTPKLTQAHDAYRTAAESDQSRSMQLIDLVA